MSEKLTYQPSEKWNEQPSYGIRKAVENIVNAPQQITTGFRAFIMNDDWFKDRVSDNDYTLARV